MGIDEGLGTWADVADVKRFTNQIVTDDDLVRAQDIIDLFSGTTFASNNQISARNRRHLNRAVAYQAGWMKARPDLFTHGDVDTVSQDGASYTPATANAQLLSPFAARWLRRLTWANKPLRVRGRYGTVDGDDGPRDSAVADDNRVWTPMR